MKIIVFSMLLLLWLTACASRLPQPQVLPILPFNDAAWFQLEQYDATGQFVQSSLLAIEQTADDIRFVQTNALGAPVARQIFNRQGWHHDGFVMPNAESRRLFAALLPALASNGAAVYPQMVRQIEADGECYQRKGENSWCIQREEKGWRIRFPHQTQWRVQPIAETE